MTAYLKDSFSIMPGSEKAYRDNYDKVFNCEHDMLRAKCMICSIPRHKVDDAAKESSESTVTTDADIDGIISEKP